MSRFKVLGTTTDSVRWQQGMEWHSDQAVAGRNGIALVKVEPWQEGDLQVLQRQLDGSPLAVEDQLVLTLALHLRQALADHKIDAAEQRQLLADALAAGHVDLQGLLSQAASGLVSGISGLFGGKK